MDDQFPEDQLFLYFESDFRFERTHDIKTEAWLPLALRGSSTWGSTGQQLMLMDAEPVAGIPAGTPAEPLAGSMAGTTKQQRPQLTPDRCSEELRNMVEVCTQAHRLGKGDLVWMGWNASHPGSSNVKKTVLGFGSQFICISRRAAPAILEAMKNVDLPVHFDNWLRAELCNAEGLGGSVGACYVVPPVGGYAVHPSTIHGTVEEPKERMACWDKSWALEGGLSEVPKNSSWASKRWLAVFRKKGGGEYLQDVCVPTVDQSFFWRTQAPPASATAGDPAWKMILLKLRWLDRDGVYIGPGKGRPKPGARRPGGWFGQVQQPQIFWKLLVEDPDGFTEFEDRASPISRLAEQLVCQMPDEREGDLATDRVKRNRRAQVNAYEHSFFSSAGKVGRTKQHPNSMGHLMW